VSRPTDGVDRTLQMYLHCRSQENRLKKQDLNAVQAAELTRWKLNTSGTC